MPITHIAPAPHPRDGYYSTNNPYQVNGPKGFTEFKYLEETHDLFVRLDFPGINKESVIILLEPLKKAVIVTGDAPKESKHDSSHRKYGTATGLICDCCEISNIQCFVGDGVVRLILSKQKINLRVPTFCSFGGARMPTDAPANIIRGYNPQVAGGHPLAHLRGLNREGCRGTDPFDPAFTGPTILPHPSVLEGSTSAYETKQLSNGGLYLRIDMPGVPSGRFMVAVDGDGVVTIMGRAPATMHDTSGRDYVSQVAIVPRGYDWSRIKIIAKHGVIRLTIPPY
ncbi:HSP20-like chaperone [Arabidopsis thaliana x Arabidopsis arenosa]|uniref:HSP20-like chaperone n=1 Tax=Arabidopsis thaliana x Arabidopsis arenosa TaxID=1240361 RepID=A0A8T1Y7E5_9BRAS|nr:HSP20-like chaperone [Arabidopsis thaliana x Arabidopsis arenosa]